METRRCLNIKWIPLAIVACLVLVASCVQPDLWWMWIGLGMAASPVYASVGHNGTIILNNGSGTTISASIITGVAAGTRIKEIMIQSGPTTAPGAVSCSLVYDDNTNQVVIDQFTTTNTVNILQFNKRYDNLILANVNSSIKVIMRTAITSGGTLHITVMGEDLT